MTTDDVEINLRPRIFSGTHRLLARYRNRTATTFRYSSGVPGIRLANRRGWIDMLPFRGQQIWDARFLDRSLTMGSMFTEPNRSSEYLRSYGAFLIHCGATAMGAPGEGDSHPLHGELPNAPYQSARLLIGADDDAPFIALTGDYQHTVAFADNYEARPTVELTSGSTQVRVQMRFRKLMRSPLELMYLTHINFRPVDGGKIVDSLPPSGTRVRNRIQPGPVDADTQRRMLARLAADPERHRRLSPEDRFDPEVVPLLDCRADSHRWAHAMQRHPDGTADFVSMHLEEFGHGIRWFSRNEDQQALGLLLPPTAEVDGYSAEKAKGNLKTVPAGAEMRFDLVCGALEQPTADKLSRTIAKSRARDK